MGNTLCGSVVVIAIANAHTQDDATDSLSLRSVKPTCCCKCKCHSALQCVVGRSLLPSAAHTLLTVHMYTCIRTHVHMYTHTHLNMYTCTHVPCVHVVSQAIRIFPRAHARGKGGGGREGKKYMYTYIRTHVPCVHVRFGLVRTLPSTCTFIHCTSARYVCCTFNTQQAPYQFWRGPCDACAADHVINSPSVFPPPHLILDA